MRAFIDRIVKVIAAEIGLREVFVIGGISCVAYGLAQIYPPAAWVVTGVALFCISIIR